MYASFEDLDGNSFGLVGFDSATKEIQEQRRAAAAKLEAQQRAGQELEIAKQVQARLFLRLRPLFLRSTTGAFALRRARWAATTMIFCGSVRAASAW